MLNATLPLNATRLDSSLQVSLGSHHLRKLLAVQPAQSRVPYAASGQPSNTAVVHGQSLLSCLQVPQIGRRRGPAIAGHPA